MWATWGRWRASRPGTVVLSTETGYARSYGEDPYGSYTPVGGYYASGGPIFPVLAESDRLPAKEVVVGVKAGNARAAIHRRAVRDAKALSFEAGGVPLLAVWDDELETARVFRRTVRGRKLRFATGQLRDATGSRWTARGRAIDPPLRGAQLEQADFLDAMWFAWYAFFPRTELVG